MANIISHPRWRLSERLITPESVFLNRRHFLRQMGFVGGGLLAASLAGCDKSGSDNKGHENKPAIAAVTPVAPPKGFPASRNPDFNPGWPLTAEHTAATYNNFYEFSTSKE